MANSTAYLNITGFLRYVDFKSCNIMDSVNRGWVGGKGLRAGGGE